MLTRMTPSLALILPFFIVFREPRPDRHADGPGHRLLQPRSCRSATWMMKGYFEGLPPNLEKAALVDGCTRAAGDPEGRHAGGPPRHRRRRHLLLPRVSWNEFLFALILTGTPKAQTIPVIIAGFLVQLRFYDYGPMFAASVLAIMPPVVSSLSSSSAIWCRACCPARQGLEGSEWPRITIAGSDARAIRTPRFVEEPRPVASPTGSSSPCSDRRAAAKSTLLYCIAGLEAVNDGVDRLRRPGDHRLSSARAQHRLVFQDYALYPHMNVRENIAFGLRQQKARRAPRSDTQVDWPRRELLGLGDLLDRRPAGALRRPAPARRRRPCRRAQSRRPADGRAAFQPRRQPARQDPHRDQQPAARARHHRRSSSPTTRRRRWCSPTGSR